MAENNNGNFIEEIAFWDFDKNNYLGNADIIFYIHSYKKVGNYSYQFYSFQHDLNQSEDVLFTKMTSNLRNVVRKARMEKNIEIVIAKNPTDLQINKFLKIYNSFAIYKNLPKMTFNFLKQLQINNKLVLSFLSFFGVELIAHSHYAASGISRLYHSATSKKLYETKVSGFANAYLTWMDILFFKKEKFNIYDFGGAGNVGVDSKSIIGIVNFKKRFGGDKIILWKGLDPVSKTGIKIIDKHWNFNKQK